MSFMIPPAGRWYQAVAASFRMDRCAVVSPRGDTRGLWRQFNADVRSLGHFLIRSRLSAHIMILASCAYGLNSVDGKTALTGGC